MTPFGSIDSVDEPRATGAATNETDDSNQEKEALKASTGLEPTPPPVSVAAISLNDQSETFTQPNTNNAKLSFLPSHQVLHGRSRFSVVIDDPDGVPREYVLKIKYNGADVTSKFFARAQTEYLDLAHRRVRLSTKNLRLLPSRDNVVEVTYRRSAGTAPVRARLLPPTCSAFNQTQPLESISSFDPPAWILRLINRIAFARGFNPNYVAGLIAQESSFNPLVVSSKGALGLTQVTSIGDAEIARKFAHWPRHPKVTGMPFPLLKIAVVNGQINGNNEWRLNPALSIQGGVEYLTYLTEYWSRTDKSSLIESRLGQSEFRLSEVILASYNSGASRVSRAIAERGRRWLQDDELNEAKKYVNRISSFCAHFSQQKEEL